ncbi:type II toxin-antitoxin system RelE/ParE family toxin [Glaciimonas immobilis]|uniref:Toxin ParE1/3/4 n=1 Tax=Glaciimonas immobilis TaxID=728004 RepID=A0A840RX86_9BURK|nr:type II toxin-antitoxin system RelE/ParE family toxin [Glaciimonas immobilis]KAF3996669.1 type II toxin-antitoxin system RelE/ParE family toxin [Glaciimonas immobilis]MBB5202515.1 toxin ParE1/3/4 [Glaciimonas immobilis]
MPGNKPVIRRLLADQDIQKAIAFYVDQSEHRLALAFLDAFEEAIVHIQRHPDGGSPRYAHELDLPGLRSWACKRFPYLLFYIERDGHIDVWRVLHAQRDIPAWLLGEGH